MIHIGMLTLAPEATQEHRETIVDGLADLVGVIPGLVSVRAGYDMGRSDGNADLIFLLEFDSEESWQSYRTHDAHVAVITERIAPVLASKSFVQVEGLVEAARSR
jgi:hypothetical protein